MIEALILATVSYTLGAFELWPEEQARVAAYYERQAYCMSLPLFQRNDGELAELFDSMYEKQCTAEAELIAHH
jgi:hypothetical protein